MKEKILTGFMWLGLAIVFIYAFQSCTPQKQVFVKQKAILQKRTFRAIGKPEAIIVNDGDTITLLTSYKKIKLKR